MKKIYQEPKIKIRLITFDPILASQIVDIDDLFNEEGISWVQNLRIEV